MYSSDVYLFFFNNEIAPFAKKKAEYLYAEIRGELLSMDGAQVIKKGVHIHYGDAFYFFESLNRNTRSGSNFHLLRIKGEQTEFILAETAIISNEQVALQNVKRIMLDHQHRVQHTETIAQEHIVNPGFIKIAFFDASDPETLTGSGLKEGMRIKRYLGEPVQKLRVEYYSRFAYPLAIPLAAISGLVLGLYLKKGSLAACIAMAVLFYALFLVFQSIFTTMGNNGILPETLSVFAIYPVLYSWVILQFKRLGF